MTETRSAPVSVEPRRWWVLAVMSVGTLLVFLDDTVVNTALPRISVDLDASASALQWVVDAYVLVLAGLLLLCGSIGDRYGRKRMMTIGLVVFGLAAAASTMRSRVRRPRSVSCSWSTTITLPDWTSWSTSATTGPSSPVCP